MVDSYTTKLLYSYCIEFMVYFMVKNEQEDIPFLCSSVLIYKTCYCSSHECLPSIHDNQGKVNLCIKDDDDEHIVTHKCQWLTWFINVFCFKMRIFYFRSHLWIGTYPCLVSLPKEALLFFRLWRMAWY